MTKHTSPVEPMLKKCNIKQLFTALKAQGQCVIADVRCYWKMTSFIAVDGVTVFLRLRYVTNTCKRMRRGLSIGGSYSVQRRKVGRSFLKESKGAKIRN